MSRSSPEVQAVAAYVGLIGHGVPPGKAFPRKLWNNTLREVSQGGVTRTLRERTKAAVEFGLIEVCRGAGRREGLVRLLEPGHPSQYVPGLPPEKIQHLLEELGDGAVVEAEA